MEVHRFVRRQSNTAARAIAEAFIARVELV
jgi:hypothetical protein